MVNCNSKSKKHEMATSRKKHLDWYSLYNKSINSVFDLAKNINFPKFDDAAADLVYTILYDPLSQYSHGFDALDPIKVSPEHHIQIYNFNNPFSAYAQIILIQIMINKIATMLTNEYSSSYSLDFKIDKESIKTQQKLINDIQELDKIYLSHENDITNYI